MLTGEDFKTFEVQSPLRIDGWIIGFSDGDGTWFYTPEEIPEDLEDQVTASDIEKKSHNFNTREEAEAFGIGFEKEVERKL